MSRSAKILAGLALLFCGAALTSYWRMPRQQVVASLRYQTGMPAEQTRRQQRTARSEERLVRLEVLDSPAPAVTVQRDIFAALYRAPKFTGGAVKPGPILPPIKPVLPVVAPPPGPPLPVLTPLQREISQFTFLGFLVKDGVKTVFLTRGKDIFLAKRGDLIADKYAITQLSNEALTLRGDEGEEIVIPLVENRPLFTGGGAGIRRDLQ